MPSGNAPDASPRALTTSPDPEDQDPRHARAYWRSVDRLLDSPALTDGTGEFPPGAVEPPDTLSRRTMIGLLGASFALAGLTACRRPEAVIVPHVAAPEDTLPGVPRHYATSMPFGGHAYGVIVESHDGRPAKIEGNPLHPSSGGAASAWMQAAILDLYDPDRSSRVLHRPTPDAAHQPADWEAFVAAWNDIGGALERQDGRGLAVLMGTSCSPTVHRLSTLVRERFPEARWVVHDPLDETARLEGARLATGDALRPVWHLDRARCLLALDADVLLTEAEAVSAARGFAAARRVRNAADPMSRLYAVESVLSLTGANADHRVAVASRDVGRFGLAVARALARLKGLPEGLADSVPEADLPADLEAQAAVIARDLAEAGAQALVIAGRQQPAAVHALALLLNEALGALGHTVTLHEPRDLTWGPRTGLGDLCRAMRGGEVSTLIVLGVNPAYTAPVDLDFAGAAHQAAHVIHLGSHADETSALAEWHLPEAHFLESWGDARAVDGTAGVVQPLIMPLHGGRSVIEVLRLLHRDSLAEGFGEVRDTWMETVLGDDFTESAWEKTLHDGVLADSRSEPVVRPARPETWPTVLASIGSRRTDNGPDALEIVFVPSAAVYDGRFANNGWLQELPDPLTKICWDNAAYLSPATARQLGVVSGDRVRLDYGGRAVDAPVWIAPGQAAGSVALALGYGRTRAGRVGTGVGVNAFALQQAGHPDFDDGLTVTRAGGSATLAQTQTHWAMEGRGLVREAALPEYRGDPHFAQAKGHLPVLPLWQARTPADVPQWGMAIDLNACLGCGACVTACQSENNIPVVGKAQVARSREMHWLRIDRYFAGELDHPEVVFQPVPCMHCENAPCEQVCPVGATMHDAEGLNAMVYNRCIGTRYCSNNCPYKVRRFNFFNYTKDLPETVRMAMNPDVTVRSRGVMEKCTYCVQRLHEAKRHAKRDGREVRDGEAKTACQQTCPAEAITFGDLRDPASAVATSKGQDRHYVLLEELGNKPRTSYLAKLRNPNPAWPR